MTDFIFCFIGFIDSIQSAETQDEKNNESKSHQSNEMKNKDMCSSGNTDEYSVLEFRNQTAPKQEYTRSQLIDLGSDAYAQRIDSNVVSPKLIEKQLVRNHSVKLIDKLDAKTATEQTFNDEFWSKATTTNQNDHPKQKFNSDYQAVLANATLDTRFVLPFNTNSKVDHWLNSGQNPSEYANATVGDLMDSLADSSDTAVGTNKPEESASTVSTKSAIRAKLLDKTAKVKQTLRNLTNNN